MKWSDIGNIIGKAAPLIGGLLGGPVGASIGGLVASALGVESTPDHVANELKNNPDALVKIKEIESNERIQLQQLTLQAETARLTQINETMRTEAQSNDSYVRRWRPTFGYCLSISWAAMFIFIIGIGGYAIVSEPQQAPTIIKSLSDLLSAVTVMWSVALAVLGVYIKKRSDDKKVTAGQESPGILQSIGGLIKK